MGDAHAHRQRALFINNSAQRRSEITIESEIHGNVCKIDLGRIQCLCVIIVVFTRHQWSRIGVEGRSIPDLPRVVNLCVVSCRYIQSDNGLVHALHTTYDDADYPNDLCINCSLLCL